MSNLYFFFNHSDHRHRSDRVRSTQGRGQRAGVEVQWLLVQGLLPRGRHRQGPLGHLFDQQDRLHLAQLGLRHHVRLERRLVDRDLGRCRLLSGVRLNLS